MLGDLVNAIVPCYFWRSYPISPSMLEERVNAIVLFTMGHVNAIVLSMQYVHEIILLRELINVTLPFYWRALLMKLCNLLCRTV